MKLSDQNILDLYKFTRQHYVEHYDVQTELVDHLANDIEEICKENPTLSFEQARDKSFKKFGIFGFMDIYEEKQKQMHKRYWKILWRFTKEWFSVPKIILTFSVFLIFLLLLQISYSVVVILLMLFCLITIEMVIIYKARKKQKLKEDKKEKIFLLEDIIGTTRNNYSGMMLVNLFNFIQLARFDFSVLKFHWILVIAAVMTLLCIFFYVSNYVLPSKSEELLEETYPEYKLINS